MRYLALSLLISLAPIAAGCDGGEAVRLKPFADAYAAWCQPAAGRSTSPNLAIKNLNARISGLQRRLPLQPNNLGLRSALLGQLLQRSSALGTFDDLDRIAALGEEVVAIAPDDPAAHIARAKALAARHLFTEAGAALDKAAALGARPGQLEVQRATLLEAIGNHSQSLAIMQRRLEVYPNVAGFGFVGHVLGQLGKREPAEAAFVLADRTYRDVSPFVLADLYFRWGLMRHQAGDKPGARQLYQAALKRLPQHAHATIHLAELSSDDEAIRLLERLTVDVDEPEALGHLAELYQRKSDPRAAEFLSRAKQRYTTLVARHPLAFADHAGWFWLGPGGDAERALSAAKTNLELRKNDEAYDLFITAAVKAGKKEMACATADRALRAPYVRPSLREAATTAYRGCGRGVAAAAASSASSVGI
ncbi:MAG TPA: hypothetical protein ENK23_04835 [Sorangium sp.]|nr:hypothetical protein [Sorangium sp.]